MIIANEYSLLINKSLTILKIENSEEKNQNSSIFAIGKDIPKSSKINSNTLISINNYDSIVLKS